MKYYILNLIGIYIYIYICLQGAISAHRKTYNPNVTNDLIDAYLHEMEARKHLRSSNFSCKFLQLTFMHIMTLFQALHFMTNLIAKM